MIRISGIKLSPDTDFSDPVRLAASAAGVDKKQILSARLSRRSVDARGRNLCFVCSFELEVRDEQSFIGDCKKAKAESFEPYKMPEPRVHPSREGERVLVVGGGPAGLFAALFLARAGVDVTLVERGEPVDNRSATVQRFFESGLLDTSSNVQFGEGGAGTFSDGKLSTGIKSPLCRTVLEELVKAGAPEEILYLAKPHVGTDRLPGVVRNIREQIVELGGRALFSTRLSGITVSDMRLTQVELTDKNGSFCEKYDRVILATGHSARDTFEMLLSAGVPMSSKPFAVGVRIEHPRELIDRGRYGVFAGHPALGAADYKLVSHGRGVRSAYTFCMCPGGVVVPAASEEEMTVTNGMSRFARDGENSNSALLVGVTQKDFGSEHPLAGMNFQRRIERAAYKAGGGGYAAPVQLVGDLVKGRPSKRLGSVRPTYARGVTPSSVRSYLPDDVCDALRFAVTDLSRQIRGFDLPDALLTGAETRSSSPVTIPRDEQLMSPVKGLYPCGEGAGHAGGIVSAAVDGIRVALSVMGSGERE